MRLNFWFGLVWSGLVCVFYFFPSCVNLFFPFPSLAETLKKDFRSCWIVVPFLDLSGLFPSLDKKKEDECADAKMCGG